MIVLNAIEFADTFLTHRENIPILLILALFFAAIIIGLSEYRSNLFRYITNRRNKWYFAFLCVSAAGIIYCAKMRCIFGALLYLVLALWLVYGAVCFLSLRPKKFTKSRDPILRRYWEYLYEGSAAEHIRFFTKPSIWQRIYRCLLDSGARLDDTFLESNYYSSITRYDRAYETLLKIPAKHLYREEREFITLRKASLLSLMGGMQEALRLLGDPRDNTSSNPIVWLAYSYIYDNAGDVDSAFANAQRAKILLTSENFPEWQRALVLNDYARYALMRGNTDEALHYLALSWEACKTTKDARLIHVTAGNLINRLAISGAPRADCEAVLQEYHSLIQALSISNSVESLNIQTEYYRQIGEKVKLYELIHQEYARILPLLDAQQAELFKSSAFQILINGHYVHDWLDADIRTDYEAYQELPLMDRLFIFQNYMGILEQEEFRVLQYTEPYHTLRETILRYYREQALGDIEAKARTIPPYQVFLYKNLMMYKLSILKLVEGKDHIERSKEQYLQLSNTLYDAGLRIEYVDVLMTLVDECSSPYNLLVALPTQAPPFTRWMHYSDWIEAAPPPPTPDVVDRICLNYYRLRLPFGSVQPLRGDVIAEYLEPIMAEVRRWKNHPAKLRLSIHIAHLLMCLERRDEAKEFFDYFERTNISSEHFSSWLMEEVEALRNEFREEGSESPRQARHLT